ncbi:MAG: glycosyltransferase family 2 protein [Planctomycetes bacterium]|nr:glycosyltransferase family 2 protein [Planctomycetota bacterium]
MPVYNEAGLLERAAERVIGCAPPRDAAGRELNRLLVVIDDGSTDGTADIARHLGQRDGIRVECLPANRGKGAAVRRGIELAIEAGADVVVLHDADLEYDPADHAALLAPILDGRADAVIGSRFLGQTHRVLYYWHSLANRAITTLSNILTNLNLSDIECCLKAFSREIATKLSLQEDRFGVEPEIIARLARLRLGPEYRPVRVYEVAVSYSGRTYAEGKKIRWQDGFEAIGVILRRNLWD